MVWCKYCHCGRFPATSVGTGGITKYLTVWESVGADSAPPFIVPSPPGRPPRIMGATIALLLRGRCLPGAVPRDLGGIVQSGLASRRRALPNFTFTPPGRLKEKQPFAGLSPVKSESKSLRVGCRHGQCFKVPSRMVFSCVIPGLNSTDVGNSCKRKTGGVGLCKV